MGLLLYSMGPGAEVRRLARTPGLRAIDGMSVARPSLTERIEIAATNATVILAGNRLECYAGVGPLEIMDNGWGMDGGAPLMACEHGSHRALAAKLRHAIDQGRALHVGRRIVAWLAGMERTA